MNIKVLVLLPLITFFISCGEEPVKVAIDTPSIQCGMCQKNIEVGLRKLKGVTNSNVDLSSKVTTVFYHEEKTDLVTIEKAISKIGYQANKILADPTAYESLPACCKIGGMDKM
tara:strand:- start:242 stop:583 length:342 start_codon:yes stop_codon:yes gene_type:complete